MESNQLTEKQSWAATSIDKNILVEAGAGSGKTAVLTERYLFALRRGFSHHEIVAITFTEKAADEMRRRIIAKYKLPEDEIWVSTIHSFCARLLRSHPLESEVDPIFDIIDESVAEIRRQTAINQCFAFLLANPTTYFRKLLELFGIKALQEIALQCLRDRREIEPSKEMSIFETIRNWLVSDPLWAQSIALLKSINIDFVDCLVERKTKIIDLISKIDKQPELISSITSLLNLSGSTKKWPSVELNKIQRSFALLKALFNKVGQLLDWEDEINEKEVMGVNIFLVSLISEIRGFYNREKKIRGELDFEDLLIKTRSLLNNQEIRELYLAKFKKIMIDEFQDTNLLQYEILQLLACDKQGGYLQGKLFIVGDPKQSIYRFRGAEVSLFNKIKNEFVKTGGEIISLSDNFRSSQSIINCVNKLFPPIFSGDRNKIDFSPLDAKSGIVSSKPSILIVPTSDADKREGQAAVVQSYILSLLREGVGAEEIAILFRGSMQIPPFEKALRECGVPCFSFNNASLFQQVEIYDLLNLLNYIENNSDITSLIGVLRSPVVGLRDQSILALAATKNILDPKNSFLDEDEGYSLIKFIKIIEKLSKIKDRIPINQFLLQVIEDTYLDMLQLSDQARENLFQVVKISEEISGSIITLRQFLEKIEFMISNGIHKSSAQPNEESSGVSLMTIHKAKGLEFRYVIIPNLSYQPRPSLSKIIVDRNGKIATSIYKSHENEIRRSWVYSYFRFLDKEEDIAESKRLLYVAMTRAISNLVLIMDEGDLDKDKGDSVLRSGSWISWFSSLSIDDSFDLIKYDPIQKNIEDKKLSPKLVPNQDESDSNWLPISEITVQPIKRGATFSITELSSYKTCPLAHYYRYREDILITEGARRDRSAGFGSDVGRWTHKLLQQWYPFDSDVKKIADYIQVPSEIKNRVVKLASNVLEPEIRYIFNSNFDDHQELSFHMKLDENIIEGIIDVAIFDGRAWRIIDYKTNKVSKRNIDHLINEYRFQLQSYATGLEMVSGKPVGELSILFLDSPFIVSVPWCSEIYESIIKEWRDLMSGIQGEQSIPKISSCPYCIFKSWCEEAKIDVLTDPEYNIEYETS